MQRWRRDKRCSPCLFVEHVAYGDELTPSPPGRGPSASTREKCARDPSGPHFSSLRGAGFGWVGFQGFRGSVSGCFGVSVCQVIGFRFLDEIFLDKSSRHLGQEQQARGPRVAGTWGKNSRHLAPNVGHLGWPTWSWAKSSRHPGPRAAGTWGQSK